MTRTELVKKLTLSAAVDEAYAASFMESFLLLLHHRLLENDSFTLPFSVTFSQKKVIKDAEEFFLITCHSSDPFDTSSADLVFAVPTFAGEKKRDKYSVFSISIDKQIIPSKEMIANGFSFEPSFSLKNYFTGKAESLLQQGEFQSKQSEVSEFAWNFTSAESENKFTADKLLSEEISKEVQEFSWDFGNNWKRELQEEDILAVEPSIEDVVKRPILQEDIPSIEEDKWSFGEEESFEEKIASKAQTKIEEVDFSRLHEKINHEKPVPDYQEVSAKTQEVSIDLSEFDNLFEHKEEEEEPQKKVDDEPQFEITPDATDDEYVHVRSTSEFMLTKEQEALLAENDPFSSFTVEREEPAYHNYSFDPPTPISEIEIADEEVDEDENKLSEEYSLLQHEENAEEPQLQEKPEKSNRFWGMVSAFLMAIIFVFLYWKMYGIPEWIYLKPAPQIVKHQPAILEREYDLPVTYPYEVKVTESRKTDQQVESKVQDASMPKVNSETVKLPIQKNELEASDIFSKNNPSNRLGAATTKTQEQQPASKPKTAEAKVPEKKKEIAQPKSPAVVKSTLVRDNIYLEGSGYVVQLSSWKSESIADQEVARLQKKGIKAYKSSAVVLKKGGTWYRVKVGGFSSPDAAYQFYKSIK